MRVVLDINVLVRAYLTPGGEGWAILNQAEESYTLILSDFIFWKLEAVLHYDHIQRRFPHLTDEIIQDHLAALEEAGELIAERTVITQDSGGSSDPEDNRILAAAIDGGADYLVTLNINDFPHPFQKTHAALRVIQRW